MFEVLTALYGLAAFLLAVDFIYFLVARYYGVDWRMSVPYYYHRREQKGIAYDAIAVAWVGLAILLIAMAFDLGHFYSASALWATMSIKALVMITFETKTLTVLVDRYKNMNNSYLDEERLALVGLVHGPIKGDELEITHWVYRNKPLTPYSSYFVKTHKPKV